MLFYSQMENNPFLLSFPLFSLIALTIFANQTLNFICANFSKHLTLEAKKSLTFSMQIQVKRCLTVCEMYRHESLSDFKQWKMVGNVITLN